MSTVSNETHEYRRQFQRWQNNLRRDIEPPPKIADEERRLATKYNLRLYCETYHKDAFYIPPAPSHFVMIENLQTSMLRSLSQLIAYPRGSGKSSLARYAILWASLHGHLRFPMLFTGESEKSIEHLHAIKMQLIGNDLLNADFPEICYPIRMSENIALRANYQTCRGKSTELKWSSEKLFFPKLEESEKQGNAGTVIGVGTIMGSRTRGPLVNNMRPDFALIDDPQTRVSAFSPKQTKRRIDSICGDIMGMAGPQQKLSMLITGTVIYRSDLIDQLLDHQVHPQFNGIRVKFFESWPENRDLWDRYYELYKACVTTDRNLTPCHDFYEEHREAMDKGVNQVYWPERIAKGYISAIETGMALYYAEPETFASEYQNEPIDLLTGDHKMPKLSELLERQHNYAAGDVPDWAHTITAFIDVQKIMTYWMVCAFGDEFTGAIIKYGTDPPQKVNYFQCATARQTFNSRNIGKPLESKIHGSLLQTMAELNGPYLRADGTVFNVKQGFVDAGYQADIVYDAMHEAGTSNPWMPYHGVSVRATNKTLAESAIKKSDRLGLNWKIPGLERKKRPVRHIVSDVNFWKTFVVERFAAEPPAKGSFALFKDSAAAHRLLGEHLRAEYGQTVESAGRKAIEWQLIPSQDNHWWDCLVGCCVAANVAGITKHGLLNRVKRKRRHVNEDDISKAFG